MLSWVLSQGCIRGADQGWFLILVPQLRKDPLPCLHGHWQNSVLCSYRSEAVRLRASGVFFILFVVLPLLASRVFLQFLA